MPNDITTHGQTLNYKGLTFKQHEPNHKEVKLALEHSETPPKILFTFYGRRLLTEEQVKEHVKMMIERREYIAPVRALL